MMRKRSAVLTIMLLFCFSLCGCIGQPSSGEYPSKGASAEPIPTASEKLQASMQELDFDMQYTNSGENCVGNSEIVEHFFEVYSPTVVNSCEELEAFYSQSQKKIPAEAARYDEAFFQAHSLILFGAHEVDELIWHEVESVYLVDEKSITVKIKRVSPEAGDLAEGNFSFYIATNQKIASDTPIELKVTDIAVLTVQAQYYSAERASESVLPSAVICSKQALEEYISRYASQEAVFAEAAKEYDDNYFKEKTLLFISIKAGEPSVKPFVERALSIIWEEKIVIEIGRMENEETQGEDVYHIFITVFRGPSGGFSADTQIEVIESEVQA